jgi:hypothetical protein
MGDLRVVGAAAAFAAALLGLAAPAGAQKVSAKSDTTVVAAPGVVVRQEPVHARILYLEEKGGMVTAVAPPVPANVPEPTPSLIPDPKASAASAPPKKNRRSAT